MSIGDPQRTVMTYRDQRGFTAIATFYVNVLTSPDRYAAALNVVSAYGVLTVASLERASGLYTSEAGPIQYGAGGAYSSIFDKALFVFGTDSGSIARYEVPAPDENLFLPDRETVDPGNTEVQGWVTAMLSNDLCSKSGAPLTRCFGGRLVRRGKPNRLTSYAFSPDLNTPGW